MARIIFALLAPVFLLACSETPSEQVRAAKATHERARSYEEWETSPRHPEALAARLKRLAADPVYAAELCETLSELPAEDLFYLHEFLEQSVDPCMMEQRERYRRYLKDSRIRLRSRYQTPRSWPPTREIQLDAKDIPVVTDGALPAKTLVLTFDDGPHPVRTPELLKLLRSENVLAQFFLVGANTLMNKDTVKAMAADGHEIGCHSFSHPDLRTLGFGDSVREIESGFEAITSALGRDGHFFRYPYGASTSQLRGYLREASTAEFFWNIDTWDWKHKDPEFLLEYALEQVDAEGRGVVLMHDIQPQTLAMMPAFLAALRQKGYSLAVFRPTRPRTAPQP